MKHTSRGLAGFARNAAVRLAGCALLLGSLTSIARADAWDKKTIVKFPMSVEVPGKVLEPGTYVFRLVDSPSDRHIVQISNERGNHVYATILAIPNYRLTPTGKSVFSFYEVPVGQPEALRAWFYPGDNYGQEFAYPKSRADILAKGVVDTQPAVGPTLAQAEPAKPANDVVAQENQTTESSTTPAISATDTDDAGVTAMNDENSQVAAVASDANPSAEEPTPAEEPQAPSNDMPKTASEIALIALIGMGSVAAAAGLRGRRSNS